MKYCIHCNCDIGSYIYSVSRINYAHSAHGTISMFNFGELTYCSFCFNLLFKDIFNINNKKKYYKHFCCYKHRHAQYGKSYFKITKPIKYCSKTKKFIFDLHFIIFHEKCFIKYFGKNFLEQIYDREIPF